MSDTATETSASNQPEFRTPEMEQAEAGRGVAPAHKLVLEDINPLNALLFGEHRWQGYFEGLRKEDPDHFNEIETAGWYWSVTKDEDIKMVSSDLETFSSAHGITLGRRPADDIERMSDSQLQAGRGAKNFELVGEDDVGITLEQRLF